MTDERGAFFEQFIDDYFAECDENLTTVRRVLVWLEEAEGEVTPPQLEELARALHTLKGLSGMVGLQSAEQLAHAMEDGVKAIPGSEQESRAPIVEALFHAERAMEATIAARRSGGEAPPIDDVVSAIAGAVAHSTPAASPGQMVRHRHAAGTLHFAFTPSAAIAARGIGVEMVRRRLESLGQVVQVVPRVATGGGVVFDFSVALAADVQPPPEWRNDGMDWAWAEEPTPRLEVRERPATEAATSLSVNVVRVELERLDNVMRLVGDLVVSRARLEQTIASVERGDGGRGALDALRESNETLEHQLRSLREGIMRIRLVAIGEVFERMRFAMRDIARDSHKAIRLTISGQDTEIDKVVVDRMLEPLLHLVRNAAVHGIESAERRVAAGKPPEGTIALRARAAGDRIFVEVEDDGGGIDIEQVQERARQLGLVNRADDADPDTLLDLICAPGLSTRASADLASGRGVGMAAVRTTIRALGGDLLVETRLGGGTKFTIELPLTLMIADALLLEVGDQPMAIPQLALREIIELEPEAVTRFENNEVMSYRGGVLPLVPVHEVFNMPSTSTGRRYVLVIGADGQLTGLVVDRIVGLAEIVVHPIADPLVTVTGVAGATELADGRVSLILDASALVRRSRTGSAKRDARAARASNRALGVGR